MNWILKVYLLCLTGHYHMQVLNRTMLGDANLSDTGIIRMMVGMPVRSVSEQENSGYLAAAKLADRAGDDVCSCSSDTAGQAGVSGGVDHDRYGACGLLVAKALVWWILKGGSTMFGFGMPELIVIGLILLVILGPDKLPELGSSLGKAIKGFKEGSEGK